MSDTLSADHFIRQTQEVSEMKHVSPASRMQEPDAVTSRLAGAAAGMVGGLVASWLMVKFQRHVWPAPKGDDGESSTTRLARQLFKLRSEKPLDDRQAQQVGSIIHYGLGAGLGVVYGAAASSRPVLAMGAGVPLGVVTELVFDQAIVPALGLSNPFWKCPVEWHVRGMAAHLVF